MEADRLQANLGPSVGESLESTPIPEHRTPKKRFTGRRNAPGKVDSNTHTFESFAKNETALQSKGMDVYYVLHVDTVYSGAPPKRLPRILNQVPAEILDDASLNSAIALLPSNYSFEIHKTIHRIRSSGSKRVALQFPEGLLLFATTISDIVTRFCHGTETVIMGDVTYGACCIDDYTARALDCDLLVHYAHSCLIPVHVTKIQTLYVFVDISIDTDHLLAAMESNFQSGKRIAMVGTIQFNATLHNVRSRLERLGFTVIIPQIAPLSKGEILGCTSPKLKSSDADMIVYLGDGRFHLESAMIHNPGMPAYRYDPYSRKLTRETYEHAEMNDIRRDAVQKARGAKKWGLILGVLGRQGNPHTMDLIEERLQERGTPYVNLLLSEIFPGKLAMMPEVECWVQVACPRLSIDWGYAFPRPLLTPYEALVVLGVKTAWDKTGDGAYPMDYYSKDGLGRTRAPA